ncbi:hypothetical protein OSTOST_21564 [Ostertagia ostertagi]
MSLSASDGNGRSAVVSLEFVVLPVDEFPPVFTHSSYTFQVPLDATAGDSIGDVLAVDADGGVHGIPEYRIEPPSDLVMVDEVSGLITLKSKPDRRRNHTVEQITVIRSQQSSATDKSYCLPRDWRLPCSTNEFGHFVEHLQDWGCCYCGFIRAVDLSSRLLPLWLSVFETQRNR